MWNALLDVLFPPRCAACDARLDDRSPAPFCGPCGDSLEWMPERACAICGECLADAARSPCARCRVARPAFDRARAPFLYGGALAQAIYRFKFGPRSELGAPLGRLFAAALPVADLHSVDLIVPVPLHPKRLSERGFEQTIPFARALARRSGRPLVRALRRCGAPRAQVGLGGAERFANVQRAFAVSSPRVAGARVLLVDDVMTTGATAHACALALRAAGALSVEVRILARASSRD